MRINRERGIDTQSRQMIGTKRRDKSGAQQASGSRISNYTHSLIPTLIILIERQLSAWGTSYQSA